MKGRMLFCEDSIVCETQLKFTARRPFDYGAMLERIRHRLGLTTLQCQQLDDLVTAIGLPKETLCTVSSALGKT
jgi:hypothetical protein